MDEYLLNSDIMASQPVDGPLGLYNNHNVKQFFLNAIKINLLEKSDPLGNTRHLWLFEITSRSSEWLSNTNIIPTIPLISFLLPKNVFPFSIFETKQPTQLWHAVTPSPEKLLFLPFAANAKPAKCSQQGDELTTHSLRRHRTVTARIDAARIQFHRTGHMSFEFGFAPVRIGYATATQHTTIIHCIRGISSKHWCVGRFPLDVLCVYCA